MKYNYLPHTTTGKPLIPKALLTCCLFLTTCFIHALTPLVRCNMAWPFSKGHLPQHRLRYSFTLSAYTFLGWLFLAPTVFAASSLVDITPNGYYNPEFVMVLNGKAYFKFSDTPRGERTKLLEYDGNNFSDIASKSDATKLTGTTGANVIYFITSLNGNAYLRAGSGIVKYDGNIFTEVNSPKSSSSPDLLANINGKNLNGKLYFRDYWDNKVRFLEYDGNTWTDITPAIEKFQVPSYFLTTLSNGKSYFVDFSSNPPKMWQYDGNSLTEVAFPTSAYTIKTIENYLTTFNDKIYFVFSAGQRERLLEFNGDTFTNVTPNRYPVGISGIAFLTVFNDSAYFNLVDPISGSSQLWKHDGKTLTEITPKSYPIDSIQSLNELKSLNKAYLAFSSKEGKKFILEYDGTTFTDVTPNGYLYSSFTTFVGTSFSVMPWSPLPLSAFLIGLKDAGAMNKIVEYNGTNYADITPSNYEFTSSDPFLVTFNNKVYVKMSNAEGESRLLVTDTSPPPFQSPKVIEVVPYQVDLGKPETFKVNGTHLTAGFIFTLADCISPVELPSRTDAQRLFQCTPTGSIGEKEGTVKTANGEVIHTFKVLVSAPSTTSSSTTTTTTVTTPLSQVTSVVPTAVTPGVPVIFTLTGINLPNGLNFTLTDCNPVVELGGGTSTQRQFQCTPSGAAGTKMGAIKVNNDVLYNFTVAMNNPEVTLLSPQVTEVAPATGSLGSSVVFTVTGSNLKNGMNFMLSDCNITIELVGGTSTQRQFYCILNGNAGVKYGLVQDAPGGTVLYNFNVTVMGDDNTLSPLIKKDSVIDTAYDGKGLEIKDELTIGKQGNVSNLVINAKVENQGIISNSSLKVDGEINGGSLSGTITNEGTLRDFEFLGIVLKGGTLAGNILNNSRVGGKFVDVTLAPDTKITGGTLEGKIQGDCAKPALLDKVRIKAGSTLNCVKLGKEVKMDKDVVLRPLIESVTPLQAPLKEATIFTVTGENLPAGMGFTVADCEHSNDELSGGTSTKRKFICIPQGEVGQKTGLVKDKPKGETLYTFEVEVIAPAIRIESISPLVTTIGSPTVFTVKGQNLPDGLGFTVGDCEHSNYETGEGSSTQRQFLCTQFGDPGKKRGLVKTAPGGEILYTFEVTAELHPRPNVYISTNNYSFHDGDTVEVYLSTDMENASISREFYDLYVVIIAPGGNNVFDIPGPGFATDPTPYLTNVQPTAEDDWVETLKYSFVANDSQVGEYQLHALLVPAGAGFPDKKGEIDNIVAQDGVTITYDPTADSVRKNTQNGNTTRANNATTEEVQIPSLESLTRSRFTRSAVTTAMKIAMVTVKTGIGIFNKKKDVQKKQANLQSAFDYYDALGDELDDNQKELLFAAKVLELVYNNVDKVTGAKVWKAEHLADGVKRVFELYNENFKEIAAYDNGFSVTLSFYHTGWFSSWDSERDLSVRVRPVVLYDPTSQFTGSNPTSLEDISIYPSTAIERAKHYFTEDIANFEVKSKSGSHELTGAVPLPGLYVVMVTDKSTGLQYKQVHLFDKLGQEIYVYIDY